MKNTKPKKEIELHYCKNCANLGIRESIWEDVCYCKTDDEKTPLTDLPLWYRKVFNRYPRCFYKRMLSEKPMIPCEKFVKTESLF